MKSTMPNMQGVLIVATDKRSFLDLKNVVLELRKRDIPYFFLYSESNTRLYPHLDINKFSYDTNIVHATKKCISRSLGCELPFQPSILLITNENWEPEKSILLEFKQLGCVVACVESTSWIVGTIKSKLEMLSRRSFPTNCIDIFFENSKWSLETKTICGWYDFKSVVVGNPKHDDMKVVPTNEDSVLLFGTMEKEARQKVASILKTLNESGKKVYYRPHPGEDVDNFVYENIELIREQSLVPAIAAKANVHMANISVSAYYSCLFNKEYVSIDEYIGRSDDLNLDFFKGNEYAFWAPIIRCTSWDEFVEKIGLDTIEVLQCRYDSLKKQVTQYNGSLVSTTNKLNKSLFDEYGDSKASMRIVDYLINFTQ